MHLLGQPTLGMLILALLGGLVLVKRRATGSIIEIDRSGPPPARLTNAYNLFFLLVVNPLSAILLIAGRFPDVAGFLANAGPRLVAAIELAGLGEFLLGFGLMAWALISLGEGYLPGGRAPRPADAPVQSGPYRLVRHPMYNAALCIALGLAMLTQSPELLAVFAVYSALIARMIPIEEQSLRAAFPGYGEYTKRVKRLAPYLY